MKFWMYLFLTVALIFEAATITFVAVDTIKTDTAIRKHASH